MGAFFTNVQIRIPAGVEPYVLANQLRGLVEHRLGDDGLVPAADGEPADREILIVPGDRWLAFYDARTEDQDNRVEVWARDISQAFDTDAFSVLVHDSDVLALALFERGKPRDRFDSNPEFSGKQRSSTTPEARAAKWASILAPGHDTRELAAVFAAKGVFAEAALDALAPAIGTDVSWLRTGYNYLVRDDAVPPHVVRVRARFAARPPWERRLVGAPRLTSQWEAVGMEPPPPAPHRVLEGHELRASAICKNRGGAARGLRIVIDAPGDCVELAQIEVVITKPGRFQMDRYPAPLVRVGGRFVVELPDVALQPAFAGDASELVGAPMDAMLDAHHAGQVHLNILGNARRAGRVTLAVEFVPLANPSGAHVERVSIEVTSPSGVPLRASGELHPYELDRLTGDAHSYLLILLDAPVERLRAHAIDLLANLRSSWPNGHWHVFASDARFEVGAQLKLRGDLKNLKVWNGLEHAIRTTKGRVTASTAPRPTYETSEVCGFKVDVMEELGAIAIWLANERVDRDAVERVLVDATDTLAKTGALVQGVLARWQIDGGGATTPYEAVVRIHSEHTADRAWATRWIRAIGRGQLWLGPALRDRAPPAALRDVVELGRAVRIPVTDVAATEAILAPLLPSSDDFRAYERSLHEL